LCRNGLEAMQPRGTLYIKTLGQGDSVILQVQDQGSGIKADVLAKIGTPFFTTKKDGTGLGLAACYTIVARHNAVMQITDTPPGTTFSITFAKN
ncbi:MAG: ATP-binding protein, partial [Peptococcaceae bacterium]|nr:ATP-binding protein [Peptococcaceae bacterium]